MVSKVKIGVEKNKDDLTNGGFDLTNGENLPKSTVFWQKNARFSTFRFGRF